MGPVLLWSLLLVAYTTIAVVTHSSGQLTVVEAAMLLLGPVVALAVALRPSWVALGMVAVPGALLSSVPTRALVLLTVATLAAHLLTRGQLYLDWKSGILPIACLVVVSYFYRAELSGLGPLIARGYLSLMAFWVLLALITYNAVRSRELGPQALAGALLFGAALTLLMELSGIAASPAAQSEGVTPVGGRLAYIAVIGFSVSLAWLVSLRRDAPLGKRILLTLLTLVFLVWTVMPFIRAAWLSGLLFVVLLARWSGKRRYWLVVPIVAMIVIAVPIARERVFPGSTTSGFPQAFRTGDITTGRIELWSILWRDEVVPALPFGNGYGHMFSLSPQRLLGFEGYQRESSTNPFVFPHNDFIYWMVELGLIGLGALVVFWLHLLRVFRRLSRDPDRTLRQGAFMFAGVLITMFIVQLVDNSFAIRYVSTPFFIAAGLLFGLEARREMAQLTRMTPDAMS
ncbi:MAG: O-antigen ligase family protein [bacterium]